MYSWAALDVSVLVEISRAARTLFDYTLACLPDEESLAIFEHWQHDRELLCLAINPF